ncbi:MAG: VCBS repeat-containing protein [Myxococcota bacterium]
MPITGVSAFAAAWEDYDGDNDLDLYVANDFGHNNLYRNDAGHFVDVADIVHAQDTGAGMAVTWGDYNNDGWMDLYVSNMFSSAGSRITHQPGFRTQATEAERSTYQRHAKGSTLLENLGNGRFRDVSEISQISVARWAWGNTFADINHDGRADLIAVNGYITQEREDDL